MEGVHDAPNIQNNVTIKISIIIIQSINIEYNSWHTSAYQDNQLSDFNIWLNMASIS